MTDSSLFDETAHAFARSADDQIEIGTYVRGRLFVEAIELAVPAGGRILDYGCGPGRIARLIAERGYRVEGLDPSAGMIEVARSQVLDGLDARFEIVQDEAASLEQGAYAGIVCSSVIEYVERPEELLARFRRALVPGGALVVSYSNRWSLWRLYAQHLIEQPHLALQHGAWSFADCKAVLRRCGFEAETRPAYFDAAPFDKRAWLRWLSALPFIGTLALVAARRVDD